MVDILTNPYLMLAIMDTGVEYMFFLLHRTFFEKKEWFAKRGWAVFAVYFIAWVAYVNVNALGIVPLNMVISMTCYFIPLFIIYSVNNLRGIVYYIFFVAIMIAAETGFATVLGLVNNVSGNKVNYDTFTPGIMMAIFLTDFIAVLAICTFGNKDKNKRLDKVTIPFLVTPVLSVIIIMIDTIRVANARDLSVPQFLELTVILTIINIVFFAILEKYTNVIKKEMEHRQNEMQLKSDAEIMEIATKTMKDRLMASEEFIAQDRTMRHDRRHFEALLMSLLEAGKYEEAKECLKERLDQEPESVRKYCDNTTVNAAITHYVSMAKKKGINVNVSTNIPSDLETDEMQLAIAISNLLENAIHACEKITEGEKNIEITARYKSQLLLEVANSCAEKVPLDENGYPFSTEDDHGIGTRSVLAFAHQTNSCVHYISEDKCFKVRMIIG